MEVKHIMKETQTEMILKYMEMHGSISQREAAEALGCYRLSARVYDLRALGFDIRREMATEKNRFGTQTTFARYWLKVSTSTRKGGAADA